MTSASDRQLVVGEFDRSLYPSGAPTLDDAWLGIYQVLWWYEHGLLHVREANDLKKSRTWQERARIAERYIADPLGVRPEDVPDLVDRMMRLPRWVGMQRNNPVGNGLRMLVSEVLQRWGDPRFKYEEEQKATKWFPGIQMHGRSATPSVDVAVTRGGIPRGVVSSKWSIRHDRISDPTNECTSYKSAAVQQQLMDLSYFVITNELDGQRLDKVINQPCVDGLIHVHLDLVEQLLGGLTPLMTAARAARRLFDLTEVVQLTYTWP